MYKYDDPKDIKYQVRSLMSTVNLFSSPAFDEILVELLCQSLMDRDQVVINDRNEIYIVGCLNLTKVTCP